MSALEKDFLKAKLGKLPLVPAAWQDEDELEELENSVSPLGGTSQPRTWSKEYKAVSGSEYFEEALSIKPATSDSTFRAYYTAPIPAKDSRGTVFVFHHGAGYSGLSFSLLAKFLRQTSTAEKPGFLSVDARGHGKTSGGLESDLSLETLATDLCSVLHEMFPSKETAPKLILVGHSMGGPVVVEACAQIQQEIAEVTGLAMLDIVEGSAIEALQGMHKFIAAQPSGFDSVEEAIGWHLASRQLNNPESAKVSVPPLIIPAGPESQHKFTWRTNLAATEPYWSGWFTNLSKKFLDTRTAKTLILAGTDRLDTELTIGQMQGKYQLSVLADVGHCLQEDAPERVATILGEFWQRNDRSDDILKNVKKVGQK